MAIAGGAANYDQLHTRAISRYERRSMRLWSLAMLLSGCVGGAELGRVSERNELDGAAPLSEPRGQRDGGAPWGDGGLEREPSTEAVAVVFQLTPEPGCSPCYTLEARIARGLAVTTRWDDGSRELARRVCPVRAAEPYTLTATAAAGTETTHTIELGPRESCQAQDGVNGADAALLCLENGSFEGPVSIPTPGMTFDAGAWRTCGLGNAPALLNRTVSAPLAPLPEPTDGQTFLGLLEGQGVSQALCEPLHAGERRSFEISLSRLGINAGLAPETEAAYLEVYGGTATACAKGTLLYATSALPAEWGRYCITVQPGQFVDMLTLQAAGDGSLASAIYVLADNLVPVAACP